jgi:hypothetical protein
VSSTEARVAFLRRIHLFHDLRDDDLAVIAGELQEEQCEAGQIIFAEGAEADRFYFIRQGSAKVTQIQRGRVQDLATLVAGDYFGEEEMLTDRRRAAALSAAEKSDLLSIGRAEFKALLKHFPRLKAEIEVAVGSRTLARKMHFDWVRDGEVIYFLARKHEVLLAQALSGPLILLLASALLAGYFFLTLSFFVIFGAGVLFVAALAWGVWSWIDWGNDYYIVTNQRVIWLEKVVALYDSRQEAPLSTVLSVGVETDPVGRLLDYGNVIIRTYVGKIPFGHVAHPFQASHMVEEQWTRTKHMASRMEKEAMRNVLRQKMGLTVETKHEEELQPDKTVTPTFYRRSVVSRITSNWFKLKVEDSGTITYRKHLFVLWRQVWQPTVLLLLMGVGMLGRLIMLARTPAQRLFDPTRTPPVDTMVLALPIVSVPILIWWFYQYLDWRNDIYQVTPDQILDIDKKPFGTEVRRAAPLENILSTEAQRVGLPGYLFNYGTVYITVGGAHLDFADVLDPAGVQADIDRRREARTEQKREAEAQAERERMSDWLVAYHENEAELRQQDGPAESAPKTE